MDNKEWVKHFEEQNGRKPTPEEFAKFLKRNNTKNKKLKLAAVTCIVIILVSLCSFYFYFKWVNTDEYFYKNAQGVTLSKNEEEGIDKLVTNYLKSIDDSVNEKSNYLLSYFKNTDNDAYKKTIKEVGEFNNQYIETKKETAKDFKILQDRIGFETQTIRKIKNGEKTEFIFYTINWIIIRESQGYSIKSFNSNKREDVKGTMKDYQVVIDEYKKAIDNNSIGKNPPRYINGEAFYKYENNKSKPVLSYALYDFDHNGVNELVIASGSEKIDESAQEKSESNSITKLKWGREIFNIITLDGSNIVDNFPQVGYRMHVYPMTDGSFWFDGSSSAFLHHVEHYKFTNDGTKITKVLSVKFDSEDKVTHKVRKIPTIEDQTGKIYTQESFQNLLNQYTVLNEDKLLWTEIK